MNKIIISSLLMMASLYAATAREEASFEYYCEVDRVVQKGKVSIESFHPFGYASCMDFGKKSNKDLICWQFKRAKNMAPHNSLFITLNYYNGVGPEIGEDFIFAGNAPFAEGATTSNKVKLGLFKHELNCRIGKVHWQR